MWVFFLHKWRKKKKNPGLTTLTEFVIVSGAGSTEEEELFHLGVIVREESLCQAVGPEKLLQHLMHTLTIEIKEISILFSEFLKNQSELEISILLKNKILCIRPIDVP